MPRSSNGALKRAILDCAREVLLEQGYTHLSMRRIANAVGCTATSIYLYFQNKDALIHTLIDEGMDGLFQDLSGSIEGVASPTERLRVLARRYIEWGLENPEYYEIMFMLHPERMERYPAAMYRRARRNLEIFTEALSESVDGKVTGESAEAELRVASAAIWTALHGAVSLFIAQRVDVSLDRDAVVAEVVAQTSRAAERLTGSFSSSTTFK